MKKFWAFVSSLSPLIIIVAVIGTLLFLGECFAWRGDHPKPPKPVPQVLAPTPAELAIPSVVVEGPKIKVLQPTAKDRKKIAKDSGRHDFAAEPVNLAPQAGSAPVLAPKAGEESRETEIVDPGASSSVSCPQLMVSDRPIPPLPDGGRLWVYLEENGDVTPIVKANDPKPAAKDRFWSFSLVYEFGAMVDVASLGGADAAAWKAWGAVEFGRAGRLRPKFQVDVESRAGKATVEPWVGAVWRSK